jgi:hypothetical protein
MPWRHAGGVVVWLLILDLGSRWLFVVNSTFQSLYPRQETPVPLEYEAECHTEPVWTNGRRGKFLAPTGIQTVDRPASSIGGIATPSLLQNMPTRVLFTVTVTKMLSLQRRITGSEEFHSGTHVGMHSQTDSFPWRNAKLGWHRLEMFWMHTGVRSVSVLVVVRQLRYTGFVLWEFLFVFQRALSFLPGCHASRIRICERLQTRDSAWRIVLTWLC